MKTDMNELESFAYVEDVIASVSLQFPKSCSCCGFEFKGFTEFLEKTYIPDHNDSQNIQVVKCENDKVEDGYIVAYRNCFCHSTITILCALEDELKAKIFQSIEKDAKKLGVNMESVMELMRDRIVAS